MKLWTPLAYPGPGDTHRNFDQGTGARGSWPDARGYQQMLAELVNTTALSGLAQSEIDSFQVFKAVRSQRANFVAAAQVAGTANDVTLAFMPPFTALADLVGVPIRHIAEADNTGAMTVKVDSLAAVARTWPDGTALAAGDVKNGRLIEEVYDGTAFRLRAVRSPAEAAAEQAKVVPISGNWIWSQSIANNVMTTLGGSAYTVDGANNLGDATFSGGVFTVGPQTAGLWIFIFSGVVTSATTDLVINNIHNNSSAIGYGTSQTSNSAPGIGAVTVKRLPNTDNMRFQIRQIVGSSQVCSGRLNAIRLGA